MDIRYGTCIVIFLDRHLVTYIRRISLCIYHTRVGRVSRDLGGTVRTGVFPPSPYLHHESRALSHDLRGLRLIFNPFISV